VKISNKKISFFPSRNQYFPHIPYVASKKDRKNKKFKIFTKILAKISSLNEKLMKKHKKMHIFTKNLADSWKKPAK
jgi:hypothetical protein